MTMRNLTMGLLISICISVSAGCDRGPETAIVSGTVTLDGTPLDDAVIEFDAGDGSPPEAIEIAAGKFTGSVLVGRKTVRLFAMRPTKPDPRRPPTDLVAPFENVLPDRYGHDSTFTVDVSGDNAADLQYDLESK